MRTFTFPLLPSLLLSLLLFSACTAETTNLTDIDLNREFGQLQTNTLDPLLSEIVDDVVRRADEAPIVPGHACIDEDESVVEQSETLAAWQMALAQAITAQDRSQLATLVAEMETAEFDDALLAEAAACLLRRAVYTRSRLDGVHFLDADSIESWRLEDKEANAPVNPIDFVIDGDVFYLLDSGVLYRGRLPGVDIQDPLAMQPLLDGRSRVEGYPIKELAAVAAADGELMVLDKSNDIYQYNNARRRWRFFATIPEDRLYYTPQYVQLDLSAQGILTLDVAGNQVWLHPSAGEQRSLLAGGLNWGSSSIGQGIDLVNGDDALYILLRSGLVVARLHGRIHYWALPPTNTLPYRLPASQESTHPAALALDSQGGRLFVAERNSRRIIVLDATDGDLLAHYVAPTLTDFDLIQGIQFSDGALYILANGRLYRLPVDVEAPAVGFAGLLPEWEWATNHAVSLETALPNAPTTLQALASLSFVMPIEGAILPARPSIYPGARRAYRYGVHRGIDFFGQDSGIPIQVGTPVRAVADGVVWKAGHDYKEMDRAEVDRLLDQSVAERRTTDEALSKLAGREIWLNHGNHIWTVYSHLDSIDPDLQIGDKVQAGQVIGTVGVSGTPDGVSGATSGAHLHFEIWLGETPTYYLGQWLSIEQARRMMESIFSEDYADALPAVPTLTPLAPASLPALGPSWTTMTPRQPKDADHYWLAQPFAAEDRRPYTDVYLFGSTYYGNYRPHHGIDISNPIGTPLLAMGDGEVIFAGFDDEVAVGPKTNFYGGTVIIRLDRKLVTDNGEDPIFLLYGHMNSVNVGVGDRVKTGDVVGTVGMTGIALGPHLHLEVRVGRNHYLNTVNPVLWITPDDLTGALAIRLLNAEDRSWMGTDVDIYRIRNRQPIYFDTITTYEMEDGFNGDPAWGENGALTGLPVGSYQLRTEIGGEVIERNFLIANGQTSFVEMRTQE